VSAGYILLLLAYLAVAVLLVWVVLRQEPKTSQGMFGTGDLFSTRGVTGGLYRVTIWLGILFGALALVIGAITS
jgi:preprotein translocase subunit SecG